MARLTLVLVASILLFVALPALATDDLSPATVPDLPDRYDASDDTPTSTVPAASSARYGVCRSACCQGDAARLLMVLNNVLANALKYSPAGGVVRVAVSRQNAGAPDRSVLHCAVTDAGPSVPAEFRERIFEKFFRMEHHRRVDAKERKGTGIGLYLCKHIITAHGGHIWCDAGDHGVGTRLALTLPSRG